MHIQSIILETKAGMVKKAFRLTTIRAIFILAITLEHEINQINL